MTHATKLSVLISHAFPLVSAGLFSTLQGIPECEVRVWDEKLRRCYGSPRVLGADIVVSDPDQGFRLLQDCTDGRATGSARVPKVLVVAALENDGNKRSAIAHGVAGYFSVQCRQQDLIDAVRSLASRVPAPPRGGMTAGTLRRVREHIDQQIAGKLSLHELADIAGLSASHFSRAFRQSVGMPPHRYLRHRRIEIAAEQIRNTALPLAQIALAVGFSDQSHFTREFVRVLGETPSAYRRCYR
jgi:AraC-like DNA-binding protein